MREASLTIGMTRNEGNTSATKTIRHAVELIFQGPAFVHQNITRTTRAVDTLYASVYVGDCHRTVAAHFDHAFCSVQHVALASHLGTLYEIN